jgi:hypothetical protein
VATDLPDLAPDVLSAANIVPATRLATDYLNVFNEAVMLLGLLPDMPEMIDELKAWEALSYEEHFRRSGFQAKELAILAYQHADPAIRVPFDELAGQVAITLREAVDEAAARIARGEELGEFIADVSYSLQCDLSTLDGMVHGTGDAAGAQSDIDALFD